MMLLKDFLMVYLAANHDVDDLSIHIYKMEPYREDGELYKMKNSLRNYLLFGDYYVTSVDADYHPRSRTVVTELVITKEKTDPLEDCPFAYEQSEY